MLAPARLTIPFRRLAGSRLARTAALSLLLLLSLGDTLQGADSINYLLLTRSLLLDGDLFLANEFEAIGKPVFATTTGVPLDIHNLGVSIFWLPFYGFIHALVRLAAGGMGANGAGIADGLTVPYVIALRLADWTYGLLALALTRAALRLRFGRRPALLGTVAVALGSPFVYHWLRLSPSSHMLSAFLSALFLYGFLLRTPSRTRWLGLGIVGGWALAVANTNIGLLAFPLVHFGTQVPSRRWLSEVVIFGAAYLLAFAPQLLAWWLFTGNPFTPTYGGQLSWTEPRLLETLFSGYHGLLLVAPLLLLALAGLFMFGQREPTLALASGLAILVVVYLSSINLAWWGGGSFGNRYALGSTPFFALGLATLFNQVERRWQRPLVAIVVACIGWTLLLYLPYATAELSLVEYHPLREQLASAARALPLLPRALYRALASASSWLVLLVPLSILIASLAARQRHIAQRLEALYRHRSVVLLPLLLLLGMAGVVARSHAARDACLAAACDRDWIRSDVDQWDLAYTYVERARYHAKTGAWDAALADLRTAVAVYPSDSRLQQMLADMEQSRPIP